MFSWWRLGKEPCVSLDWIMISLCDTCSELWLTESLDTQKSTTILISLPSIIPPIQVIIFIKIKQPYRIAQQLPRKLLPLRCSDIFLSKGPVWTLVTREAKVSSVSVIFHMLYVQWTWIHFALEDFYFLTIQIIYRLLSFVLFYFKTVMNLIFLANYAAN